MTFQEWIAAYNPNDPKVYKLLNSVDLSDLPPDGCQSSYHDWILEHAPNLSPVFEHLWYAYICGV